MNTASPITPPAIDWNNFWLFVEILIVTILGGGLGGLVNYILAQSEKKSTYNQWLLRQKNPTTVGQPANQPKAIIPEPPPGGSPPQATQPPEPNGKKPAAEDLVFPPDQFLTWGQSIIIGVAAALLVPLLLSLIQSNLFDTVGTNVGKLYIYAGFCVASGVASRTLVRSMSDYIAKKALLTSEVADRKSDTAIENSEKAVQQLNAEAERLNEQIGTSQKKLDENNKQMQEAASRLSTLKEEADKIRKEFGEARQETSDMYPVINQAVQSEIDRRIKEGTLPSLPSVSEESVVKPLSAERDLASLEEIETLERTYSSTRAEPRGASRTYKMTDIIRKMIGLMEKQTIPMNVHEHLQSGDFGKRLSGIARLYVNPDIKFLPELLEVISKPDKEDKSGVIFKVEPFAQYWGIQVIDRILQKHASELDKDTLRALYKFRDKLGISTDRYSKLSQILSSFEKPA